MDQRQLFFTAARIIIVAGKGGVGKTTAAATLGVAATSLGIETLLVEIEGKRGLASLFGHDDLVYDDTVLVPADAATGRAALRARTIAADAALLDYFADHGLKRFGKTLTRMQVLDTLATSTPGLRDLIVLGKIKQLEATSDARLLIVDAPASGHAISFLRAARGLQQSVDAGPIRKQADEVVEMLTDRERAQVLLVTLAEETPVNELIETAYALEDEVGIALGPAIVNAVLPAVEAPTRVIRSAAVEPDLAEAAAAAATFHHRRLENQAAQMAHLADELPLDQLTMSRQFTTRVGRAELDELAAELLEQLGDLQFGAPT